MGRRKSASTGSSTHLGNVWAFGRRYRRPTERAKKPVAISVLLALLVMFVAPAAFAEDTPQTIVSDKADYAPGETVILTGTNGQPGEQVHIRVNDDQRMTWLRDVDVYADGNGNIRDEFQLPDWFVATYTVTATGPISGTATTAFTDGNVRIRSNATGI